MRYFFFVLFCSFMCACDTISTPWARDFLETHCDLSLRAFHHQWEGLCGVSTSLLPGTQLDCCLSKTRDRSLAISGRYESQLLPFVLFDPIVVAQAIQVGSSSLFSSSPYLEIGYGLGSYLFIAHERSMQIFSHVYVGGNAHRCWIHSEAGATCRIGLHEGSVLYGRLDPSSRSFVTTRYCFHHHNGMDIYTSATTEIAHHNNSFVRMGVSIPLGLWS